MAPAPPKNDPPGPFAVHFRKTRKPPLLPENPPFSVHAVYPFQGFLARVCRPCRSVTPENPQKTPPENPLCSQKTPPFLVATEGESPPQAGGGGGDGQPARLVTTVACRGPFHAKCCNVCQAATANGEGGWKRMLCTRGPVRGRAHAGKAGGSTHARQHPLHKD